MSIIRFTGFGRELSDEEFEKEIKSLQQQIDRQKKKNELIKIKNELKEEVNKGGSGSGFGKTMKGVFEVMAEMGRNVNKNIADEKPVRVPDVSKSQVKINFDNKSNEITFRKRS